MQIRTAQRIGLSYPLNRLFSNERCARTGHHQQECACSLQSWENSWHTNRVESKETLKIQCLSRHTHTHTHTVF